MISKEINLCLIASLLMIFTLLMPGDSLEARPSTTETDQGELYDYLFQLRENVVERRVDLGLTDSETGEWKQDMLAEHQEKGAIYIIPFYLPRAWFVWDKWPSIEDKIRALEHYRDAMGTMDIEEMEKDRLKIDLREAPVTEHLQSEGLSEEEIYQRLFELREENVRKRVELGWFSSAQGEMYLEMISHQHERGRVNIIPYYAPGTWFSWEEWPGLKDKIEKLETYLQALDIKYEARQEIP